MIKIRLPVDRSYLLINQDGGHSILSGQTEPNKQTLAAATADLASADMAGWCVLSEGRHGTPGDRLALLPIESLTSTEGNWEEAAEAFDMLRATAYSI